MLKNHKNVFINTVLEELHICNKVKKKLNNILNTPTDFKGNKIH